MRKTFLKMFMWFLLLLPVYVILYKVYIPKISAFGCFDDCFNYVGGYFLSQGKRLYTEIYFNHQPLMAYISLLVQQVRPPINIYALLLEHRQFLLLFSFVWNIFLCFRFGLSGFLFMLVFEFSKFYVFGDRFLAESFIVYPLVYLLGLSILSFEKKVITFLEILFASVCTWFVVFMREPYVIAALFLYGVILHPVLLKKKGLMGIAVFILLTVGLCFLFSPKDYFYNVIVLNIQHGFNSEIKVNNMMSFGLIKSFFYPLYLLFVGNWNELRIILFSLSTLCASSLVLLRRHMSLKVMIIVWMVLGLANLRPTEPGYQYYEAFHMVAWYALFIFATTYMFIEAQKIYKKPFIFFSAVCGLIGYICFSPRSFIYQRVDSHAEFITNYGQYLQISEVIRIVSSPSQTMFTDGAEELLYFASKRPSSYPYAFYYPSTPGSQYFQARMNMFYTNPPDVYYDFCTATTLKIPSLPISVISIYTRLYSYNKPTCLFIKTALLQQMTLDQQNKLKDIHYSLSVE